MIRVRSLVKRYGRREVLRGLDLDVEAGRITAVLGPNGAGKTTLIKACLGLVHVDGGTIEIDGEPVGRDAAYRSAIGYMPQIPRYPENLTVREIIAMIRDIRGNPSDPDTSLLEAFDVEAYCDTRFRALSGGSRQRVSASLAFMFRPKLLFLDEPTAGLDPLASSTFKDRIRRERDEGRTIVMTSHVMSEIEELADTVIYILDGRVQFEESVETLLAGTGESTLERALARMMIRAVA